MSQVSHGTITVSDLTDITDVFLQYGLALDNAVVDNSYPFNGIDETGWFILTEDTTVNTNKIYFRLNSGIYKVIINPTGNPYAQGWYESAPYPIWQSGYQVWIRQIQIKEGIDEPEYGTPYLDTAVNQINTSIEAINDSIYTISTNITGLDNRLATFFWPGDSSYSGAFAVSTDSITKTNANTYGFNTRVATGLVSIGYNKIPLSEWGINKGLRMYYPILDNGIVVDNKLGMQLAANALNLYNPVLSYREYMGNSGIPKELRLYEYSNLDNTYILTQDMTFVQNKTYYENDIIKGLEITADGISMYNPSGEYTYIVYDGETGGSPYELELYINDNDIYRRTTDEQFDQEVTYYIRQFKKGLEIITEGINIYNPNGTKGLDIKDNGLTIYSVENSSEIESTAIHPIVAIKQDIFTLGFDLTELDESFDPYSDGNEEPFIVWKKDNGNTYLYEYLDDIIIKDSNGRYALKEKINTIEQNITTNADNIITINNNIDIINSNIYDITSQLNKAKNDISINANNISTNANDISSINTRINKIKAYWIINSTNNHLTLTEGGL